MMITDPNVARLQVADRTRQLEDRADAHRARQAARRDLGLSPRRTRLVALVRRRAGRRSAPVSAPPARPVVRTRAC